MKKIVICGGHFTPAFFLIEELQKHKNIKIYFIGRKQPSEGSSSKSAEFEILSKKNIKFYNLITGRLQRKFTPYTIFSVLKIPLGFLESFFLLLLIRPNVVVSFGSYISSPVVFASWLLGISSITHEQATIPGLATKFNAIFCDKLFLTWQKTKNHFHKENTFVIGNISGSNKKTTLPKDKNILNFIKENKNYIFVTGGNQGSHFLNNLISKLLKTKFKYPIIHQLGLLNYKNDHGKAKSVKSQKYLPLPYINPEEIGYVLENAKVVISRSGANTVWELATYKKPSILIPLPTSAAGEQQENANVLKNADFAKVILQKDASVSILNKELNNVIGSYSRFKSNAEIFNKSLPKDGLAKLTETVLTY